MREISRDDLIAHREAYWHPQAARIVISGGIAPEAAFALAEDLFGDWQSDAPVPAQIAERAGPVQPVRTVVIDLPEAGQAAVYLAGRGPSRASDDYYPLVLANAVLGGGSSGRLFEEIRTKRSLSYGAGSGIATLAEDSLVQGSSQTDNGTVGEVLDVMLGEFGRIGTEPLSEDLLERRRLFLIGGNSRGLESSAGYAGRLSNLLTLGIDPTEIANYDANINAATGAQATAAAAEYFAPDEVTVVIVGNAAEFIDDVRAIRPNVEVIPADQLDLFNPQVPQNGG